MQPGFDGLADGKPCKCREFLNQQLKRLSLSADNLQGVFQDPAKLTHCLWIRTVQLLESTVDALRGKLDRSQGVLDFMSQSPGDFLPGGKLLGSNQLSELIQNNQEFLAAPSRLRIGSDSGRNVDLLVFPTEQDLAATGVVEPGPLLHFGELLVHALASDLAQGLADNFFPVRFENAKGGPVDGSHNVIVIDAHHSGADILKNPLNVIATFRQLSIGLKQLFVSSFELTPAVPDFGGHPVEGIDQNTQFIDCSHVDSVVEVAFRQVMGTPSQSFQWNRDLAGNVGPQPDEAKGHGQCRDGEDQNVVDLNLA